MIPAYTNYKMIIVYYNCMQATELYVAMGIHYNMYSVPSVTLIEEQYFLEITV